MIDFRQRDILRSLFMDGPSSRWELHQRTGHTPNRVGLLVDGLVKMGLLREGEPEPKRVGRPRVPVEIDPAGAELVGLAITPGGVDACRMNLMGSVLEHFAPAQGVPAERLIAAAVKILARACSNRTIGIGVSVTGFIDPTARHILLSSAMPAQKPVSLRPIDEVAEQSVTFGNDMQALAARWAIEHRNLEKESVLLVWFDDGRLGSAFLPDGRPYRGALAGGNELGHTRFPVQTERCFCGHTGCLERIVSSDFLRRQSRGKSRQRLREQIGQFDSNSDGLMTMVNLLAAGLGNAVNLLRPQRLVLVGELTRATKFRDVLSTQIRDLLIGPLQDLVKIDFHPRPVGESAVDAAWLAAAELLWTGWDVSAKEVR
jgi:predicted NBD/HSP70 family sugar kinase